MSDPLRQTTLPKKIEDVLFRIQRGLAGYMSYLATCDMNEAFSEYVLYEPILRILLSQGFAVECEVPAPRVKQPKRGDKKRLDFWITKPTPPFAIEVKWAWPLPAKLDIRRDVEKLAWFCKGKRGEVTFLCVFGPFSKLDKLVLPQVKGDNIPPHKLENIMEPVFAEFRRTRYGVRVYQLTLQ